MSYTWNNLPRANPEGTQQYSYTVTETAWTSGYHRESGETTRYLTQTDEQSITNVWVSGYELPQTGGPGTALFGLLGGLMVITAGAVLTLRKKKNKA